ncbi:prepilin-type N-terminal cleavage/methylation domain-containing protein [Opitutaceae bacterium TAV1]|nr:prepilin-type N-terminal cleavage/methylation domain-containing protein [Opitutaceae bacterium TAV1]
MTPSHRSLRAFTLIELLTVIAIIGILAGIIIPTVGAVRKKARSIQCASNMRQIGMALFLHADDHKDAFPLTWQDSTDPKATWMMAIIPYANMPEKAFGYDDATPRAAGIFVCPEVYPSLQPPPKSEDAKAFYGYNRYVRESPWNYKRSTVPAPSRTFLILEGRKDGETFWPHELARRHPGDSANFLFVDGHVAAIKGEINDPGSYDIPWAFR